MPSRLPILLLPLVLVATPGVASDFSVSGDSPEALTLFLYDESDVIEQNGTQVSIAGSLLGLSDPVGEVDDDELNALSFGRDFVRPLGPNNFASLQYSVDRGTVGNGGTVTTQVNGNGAAGDKFRVLILRTGNRVGPFLDSDAPDHDLTDTTVGTQSELDALSEPPGSKDNVYFTVDRDTAARMGVDPADILFVRNPGFDAPVPYATRAQLGLTAGDALDAIAVLDLGERGKLDAGDVVWASVDRLSPTRPALVPGGGEAILQLVPGPVQVAIPSDQLDLSGAATEEVDAITASDPGRQVVWIRVTRVGDEIDGRHVLRLGRWLGVDAADTVVFEAVLGPPGGNPFATPPALLAASGDSPPVVALESGTIPPGGTEPFGLVEFPFILSGIGDLVVSGFLGGSIARVLNGDLLAMSGDEVGSETRGQIPSGAFAGWMGSRGGATLHGWRNPLGEPRLSWTHAAGNEQVVFPPAGFPFVADDVEQPSFSAGGEIVARIRGGCGPFLLNCAEDAIAAIDQDGGFDILIDKNVSLPAGGLGMDVAGASINEFLWVAPLTSVIGTVVTLVRGSTVGGALYDALVASDGDEVEVIGAGPPDTFQRFQAAGDQLAFISAGTLNADKATAWLWSWNTDGPAEMLLEEGQLSPTDASEVVVQPISVTQSATRDLQIGYDTTDRQELVSVGRREGGFDYRRLLATRIPTPIEVRNGATVQKLVETYQDMADPGTNLAIRAEQLGRVLGAGEEGKTRLLNSAGVRVLRAFDGALESVLKSREESSDLDGDGQPDDGEDRLSGGDGNGDLIGDSMQAHVANVSTPCGPVTIVVDEPKLLRDVLVSESISPSGGLSFPFGQIRLRIENVAAGEEVEIKIFLPPGKEPKKLFKQTGEGVVEVAATILPGFVSFRIVEGGALDLNGSEAGITDPILLAVDLPSDDGDADGLLDSNDNCSEVPNGPFVRDAGGGSQLDTDGDRFGNLCDCDFDNDGDCDIADFQVFLLDFIAQTDGGAGTDMDGDGAVNLPDFGSFLTGFQRGAPGPSGRLP